MRIHIISLHPSVLLTDIVHELLRYGAVVKEKNSLGWTPLDESISYGDRSTSKWRERERERERERGKERERRREREKENFNHSCQHLAVFHVRLSLSS